MGAPDRGHRRVPRTSPGAKPWIASSARRSASSAHPAFGRAGIPRAKALEICRTVVTAGNALQDRALADDRPDFEALVEETQPLVKGYLGTSLP